MKHFSLQTHSSIEVEVLQILQDSEEMLQQDGSFLEAPHLVGCVIRGCGQQQTLEGLWPGQPKGLDGIEGPFALGDH